MSEPTFSPFKYLFIFRRLKQYAQRAIHTKAGRKQIQKKILWELFEVSNQFLRDLDADYWSDCGTLLGFYRENDIIAHDIDIDFGCRKDCFEQVWSNRHKLPKNFHMYDISERHNGLFLYINYKGYDADIYFYNESEKHLHTPEKTSWENYSAPIPKEIVFPTTTFRVKGISTKAPAKIKEYLTTIFGNLSADAVRNPDTGFWE